MNRIIPVVLLPLFLADLAAQEAPPIVRGARVRVEEGWVNQGLGKRENRYLVGTTVSLDADTLMIWKEGKSNLIAIPRSSIVKIEVSQGWERRTMKGVTIGFFAGGLFSLLAISGGDYSDSENEPHDWATVDMVIISGVILAGGILGAGIGALIGSIPSERWKPVPLPLYVSMSPKRGEYVILSFEFGK